MKAPLTQKARGVLALKLYSPWSAKVPHFYLVQDEADVDRLAGIIALSAHFGRFCPPSPEHGYIESRRVMGKGHLLDMLKETKAVHEKSEIMLMPYYEPATLKGSFVWTPKQVTYGEGNDGATAGKPGCLRMPLVPTAVPQILLDAAGVPEGMSPYIEGLHTNYNDVALVQLRYGPEPPAVLDFVPEKLEVKEIVPATGDLMEFAKVVKSLAAGTVVDHFGGSLTSHYGVHCLTNGVPIVTTKQVKVGDVLEAVQPKMAKHDPAAVAKWFVFATRDARSRFWKETEMGAVCNAALFTVHNAAAMGDLPEVVGAALAGLMKLCTAACHGEARYSKEDPEHGHARMPVFRRTLKTSMKAVAQLPEKLRVFEGMGPTPGGYGGQPWAKCTLVTMELVRTLQELVRNPCDETLAAALSQANVVVNEAHNGGWWLNKFTEQHVFNACSNGSPWAVAYAAAGLKGFLASAKREKPSVVNRVVGFRKNVFLKAEPQVRKPVLRGYKMDVLIQPVTGEAYVVGPRWGWKWKLPEVVAAKAAEMKIPMCWQRVSGTYDPAVPVENGQTLTVCRSGHLGYFTDLDTSQLTMTVKGFEWFDALANPQYVQSKTIVGALANSAVTPLGLNVEIYGLCESCARVLRVRETKLCENCGGPKAGDGSLCKCGKKALVQLCDGELYSNVCLECMWVNMTEREMEIREENQRPVVVEEKIEPWMMCAAPYCASVFHVDLSAGKKHKHCGCLTFSPKQAEMIKTSFTLENLKELS